MSNYQEVVLYEEQIPFWLTDRPKDSLWVNAITCAESAPVGCCLGEPTCNSSSVRMRLGFWRNKHAEWNKRRSWFIAGNFSLRHATKCHTYHFSSPRLELFHLSHSRYFVKLEPTRGAYDPMDSRLLRSTSDMSELSQCQWVFQEVEFLKQAIAKG